jgi:hypothetical protein
VRDFGHCHRSIRSCAGLGLDDSIVSLPSLAVKGITGASRHIRLVLLSTAWSTPPDAGVRAPAGAESGEEPERDERAGHCPMYTVAHADLADVGAVGGLEYELLGGQGADKRLLAC